MVKKGNDNFAKNLKILRARYGLEQATVAEAVGVNSRTYQKYEYGQATPAEAKKEKLANLFKVTVADLYKDDINDGDSQVSETSLILKKLDTLEAKIEKPTLTPDPKTETALALLAKIQEFGDDLVKEMLGIDILDANRLRRALYLKPLKVAGPRARIASEHQEKEAETSHSKKGSGSPLK